MSANPTASGPWPAPSPREDRPTPGASTALSTKLLSALSGLRRMELFGTAFLRMFRTMQAAGFSVLPNHFYWPVPDLRTLEQRDWHPRHGSFELNMPRQCELARHLAHTYAHELDFPEAPTSDPGMYHRNNGFFESVDAELAYCMVRECKPRRIVEIGGGYSTRVMAAAVRANALEGHTCTLSTVEPHPDATLRNGFEGLSALLPVKVQDAPLDLFTSLRAGDILFIDSSHVVTVGSDVVHEFFEILPRLQEGVTVHFHDIFYPSDYPRDAVLNNLWFWSEQYLLEAFLTSNNSFQVLWGSSAMQLLCPEVLEECFRGWGESYKRMSPRVRRFLPTADGRRVWPSSFWIRKVNAPITASVNS